MSPAWPSWLHWYRKPSYREFNTFSRSANATLEDGLAERPPSISSQSDAAIPSNLSLDCVLAGKTCSPLSLYDFYMYLKHIEMSQENLEFYIWFKNYEARYPQGSQPELPSQTTPLLVKPNGEKLGSSYTATSSESDSDTIACNYDPGFEHYIETLMYSEEAKRCRAIWSRPSHGSDKTLALMYTHREELQNVAGFFLTPGAPRELNLPSNMRKEVLAGIAKSDSPASLAPVADHVYYLLRNCSHRNFIRLGVKNGTFETLCMVTIVGVLFTALGLLTMLLIAFASPSIHHSTRWRGLAAAPFWVVGFSFLFAGWRGSCFLLLLFSRRQELPWERVDETSSTRSAGSATSWSLARFAKRLMIFERKIRVKDQGLRDLQRKIVLQSIVAATIATTILEVLFLCVPIWR